MCTLGAKLAQVNLAGPVLGYIPKLTLGVMAAICNPVTQLTQQAPVAQPSYLLLLLSGGCLTKIMLY